MTQNIKLNKICNFKREIFEESNLWEKVFIDNYASNILLKKTI